MTYGSSHRDGRGENLFELKGLSNPTNGVMYRCDEFCSLIRAYRMMFHVAADDFCRQVRIDDFVVHGTCPPLISSHSHISEQIGDGK
jgi:hypothetical protein